MFRSPYDLETVIVLEGSEYYEFIHGEPMTVSRSYGDLNMKIGNTSTVQYGQFL
jgi:hypothetical protein